ncbi:MAG TPA: hypothetical protein VK427_14905, partial [Kofleriaceae bacterium]|nr:hypothetical protein [Kofleriaceae bacterium]
MTRSFDAERNREVRLPGTDASGKDYVLGALKQPPRARSLTCAASTPSDAEKSNWSSVLTSGKRIPESLANGDSRRDAI